MKIMGIDEAGRGSVLGPLVVCGVALEEERIKYLERLGLKDSKKVSPKRRIALYRKINRIAECHTVHITAKDIDMLRSRDVNLNEIEKIAINRIIGKSSPSTCFIDSMDVKPERLTGELEAIHPEVKVVAEHKADDRYPIVSAASIIAKVERDRAIQDIRKECKADIGSGYPSDPKTIKFLKTLSPGELPDFVRRSWATVEKIIK
ncbi:ribonuclease HII [Methanobacterium petrolearium]|uniref:ribonuclease HII n=1 Tax=Methanobacterium petrolearium TaxID=710190 RepID=UPI001AE4BB65|nr:ribonuclease HII [Methanobacterium petrolearium]MBP1945060.1 ribonuclease HII [Methanobacterium petrolearium]BDZ70390.1 ribonuclease HII [Methanobacterium petrolearium]